MASDAVPSPLEPDANDEDAVWADLVARLEETPTEGPGPRQDFSDFDPLGIARPAPIAGAGADTSAAPAPPPAAASGPRNYGVDDEEEGAFVPEDPPSLAAAEPALLLAWVGAAGAPIVLLLAAILWRGAPLVAIIGIILVFVASAGYLVFRLPASRDDDGDDGAVL
jgi:hypothetical protein